MRDMLDDLLLRMRGAPWWRKALLGVAVVFVAIGVLAVAVFISRRGDDDADDSPAWCVARDRGDRVDESTRLAEEKDRDLADRAEAARDEREKLEAEIAGSGEGRTEFHEEVDRAAARGDIDGILAARDRRRRRRGSDD